MLCEGRVDEVRKVCEVTDQALTRRSITTRKFVFITHTNYDFGPRRVKSGPDDTMGDVPDPAVNPTASSTAAASASSPTAEFRISRLSYLTVPMVALVVIMLMAVSPWFAVLFVVPLALIWWIARVHTSADATGLTAVGLTGSTRLAWGDIAGLRFPKWSAVRAVRPDGGVVRLPGVTFRDLPRLSDASGGRVPDPFAAEREARLAADHED